MFESHARNLHEQVVRREQRTGRSTRRGELPERLRAAYERLARRVRAEARGLTTNRAATLRTQLDTSPSRLIGVEDITMATWLALNIEPQLVALQRRAYRQMNESVARRARREIDALKSKGDGYYAVASAVDYNTALDAGRAFATHKITRAAMGFGAFMADDHYTDHVVMGRRLLAAPVRMANRYLRTALVARGFWDGYREAAGNAPRAFHFLGLGAPVMLPLVAMCAAGTPLVTFDATSPLRDAAEGTLYLLSPTLKVRTRRLALHLASGTLRAWDCTCPFCARFIRHHPFDYRRGRRWQREHPGEEPSAASLRPGGALFKAFPLLAEPASGELRRAVTSARSGHNHWVLLQITRSLDRHSASRGRLASYLNRVVTSYEQHTNAPQHAAAVRFAVNLATGALERDSSAKKP
jgi:hypothetical protein